MLFSNSLLKNSSRSLAWFYLNSLRNGYESSIFKGTLTDCQKQQLAGLLNHYGIELQAVYGYSSNKASDAIQIYTQVSIKALQAVHASTHPAECVKSEHDNTADDEYD